MKLCLMSWTKCYSNVGENAEKLIKEKRPYIRLNGLHRKALEEWSKHRLSPPKRNGQSGVSAVILSSASAQS
ncbi:UNVERIFIED_CONTAM: hypothetical protein Sradi_6567400 [Sesamum radiatum]|uniref:Uncharacterized protein n=1 Tax=Sesamum radiatum TaxID=300843 RepID=A0AAW2JXK7_SESRA